MIMDNTVATAEIPLDCFWNILHCTTCGCHRLIVCGAHYHDDHHWDPQQVMPVCLPAIEKFRAALS